MYFLSFDALYIGRAQLFSVGDNKVIGTNTEHEIHLGYFGNSNVTGKPLGMIVSAVERIHNDYTQVGFSVYQFWNCCSPRFIQVAVKYNI